MEPTDEVIIHLDTSVLIDALSGPRRSLPALERAIARGHVPAVSTLVLYEWFRGPRTEEELDAQEALLPVEHARAFGATEALRAARLCGAVKRPRGRDMDLAIAACVLEHGAVLWTNNRDDFADIPDLRLFEP